MIRKNDQVIKKHYKEQVKRYGLSGASTMDDEVVREKEIQLIINFLRAHRLKTKMRQRKILDLGCGNGYSLDAVAKAFSADHFWGGDFSPDMLSLARTRKLPNCSFLQLDARKMQFVAGYFDVVYSERCLINIMDWPGQKKALEEVLRVLRPGGYYLMLECFTDGLANINKARGECNLEATKEAFHNRYFDKTKLSEFIKDKFAIIDPKVLDRDERFPMPNNFLSSHYFISRVVYPLITQGHWVRNSEFVKFFSFLPAIGNYSQIQAIILQKINTKKANR